MQVEPDHKAAEFVFNYRTLSDDGRTRSESFEGWMLLEGAIGLEDEGDKPGTGVERAIELTNDLTDVRITMQLNGEPINPGRFFNSIWLNLEKMAQRAAVAQLGHSPRLDNLRDRIDTIERKLSQEMREMLKEAGIEVSDDDWADRW